MAKRFDWVAIEKDYRTGRYSNCQLSKMHGPTEGTIRARIKSKCWVKDLSAEVKFRIAAELQNKAVDGNANPSEEEIVKAAVDTGVAIIREHRTDIKDQRVLVESLTKELSEQLGRKKLTIKDKDGKHAEIDLPLEYIGKVINMATQSLERLVKMERHSFKLDDEQEEDKGKSIDDLLAELPDVE